MTEIKITLATKGDKDQLKNHFSHYKVKEIINQRVDCYLSHNFTIVAKNEDKIVGVLQWYLKEDPNMGVVEFEEVYVNESYRRQGIGFSLVTFAIQTVRELFKKNSIEPRRIFLFTSKGNKPACCLFEKCGFKSLCEVGYLLSDKEIEKIYSLQL